MKFRRATILFASLLVLAWIVEAVRPTSAMPNFAQAYGVQCQTCHTVVPALNSYGRYVQRTGYASLDAKTIERADPFWIGENPTYDSSSGPEVQWGNLAIHAAGFIGNDWTFHLHQWVIQDGVAGGTDTLWVTYNNILHRDGHWFVGKIEAPAPSPFSQFFDLAAFAPPEITVGEHTWPFDQNRWGSKIAYVKNWFTADVSYLGPNGDITGSGGAGDWSSTTEKTFQYHLVDGPADKPVEFGIYGGVGTFPTSDGQVDKYNGAAGYVEADPQGWVPGAFAIYQHGYDSHPGVDPTTGLPLNSATSTAFTAEVYEELFKQHVIVAYRNEYTNDGLGSLFHYNYINAAWMAGQHVGERNANGLIVNLQASMNPLFNLPSGGPTWQGQIWYVTTIGGVNGK
jgi:hypothetical protein